jgi:neutral ceramidase
MFSTEHFEYYVPPRRTKTTRMFHSTYKAGAASECITPNESLWLAGYAARTATALGKISDLYASALALEDATGNRFVIATADVIAITPAVSRPIIETAAARHGLARNQILLAPSHTHYGPEFRIDKQPFFKIPSESAAKIPATAEKLAAALASVIGQALTRLEPVRLFARKTSASFAHNRRRHGVVGGTASTDDLVDHDVPVLDCVNEAGQRTAIVFGYACHNTTIPWQDLRYCGDWAGFAIEQLQHDNPTATALFVPGAGADQDPEPHGSVELSQQHGKELADAVQSSLVTPGVEITGHIAAAMENVTLPLEPFTQQSIQSMLDSDDPPQRTKAQFLLDQLQRGEPLITAYSAPIQVVRFGNELLMIALSGEPVIDWAHKLKQSVERTARAAATPTPSPQPPALSPLLWIAGYCNDMFGYLPTRRIQSEGGYEAGRANLWSWIPSPFTNDVEDRISDAVHQLMAKVGTWD